MAAIWSIVLYASYVDNSSGLRFCCAPAGQCMQERRQARVSSHVTTGDCKDSIAHLAEVMRHETMRGRPRPMTARTCACDAAHVARDGITRRRPRLRLPDSVVCQ